MNRRVVPGPPTSLAEYFARPGADTQDRLAASAGVSQAHISRVTAGEACSLALAKKLSSLTGVPLESFGGNNGGNKPARNKQPSSAKRVSAVVIADGALLARKRDRRQVSRPVPVDRRDAERRA